MERGLDEGERGLEGWAGDVRKKCKEELEEIVSRMR